MFADMYVYSKNVKPDAVIYTNNMPVMLYLENRREMNGGGILTLSGTFCGFKNGNL